MWLSSAATLFDQFRNQARPTRLVAGADTRPIVSVKILMELNQVAPIRIILEFFLSPINRSAIAIAQEDAYEPAGQIRCYFP